MTAAARSEVEAPLIAGPIELRPLSRELWLDGAPQKLGARAFDLLELLMREPDRPHAKRELHERVWCGLVVSDNNLEVHVWALRKLLGAQAILTVPGRGYRFGLAVQPAPARSATREARGPLPAPTGLPARLPPLIGRADEMAALAALVQGEALVTVVGGGGLGKTLLVQHLLDARRDDFEQGVCWVDLSALCEPSQVAPGIAAAVGIPLGAADDAAQALAQGLATLSLLLAIDNAEPLIDEVARVVAAVCAASPRVHVVVTSQLPLQLRAEKVFRLGPLAVPDKPIQAGEVSEWGAMALLEARVRAVDRDFGWTSASLESARRVCLRLDGAPLAIELAAARVPLLGLQALDAALDEPLAWLTQGPRDAPARQRSLRAALEWSHALLGADERVVFSRLAVFAGGAGLELLQAVLCTEAGDEDGCAPLDRPRLLDALDGLVERSLVVTSWGAVEPRYRLLETPHALARERLVAAHEGAALDRRLARAVARQLCDRHACLVRGEIGYDAAKAMLDPDLDNARAGLRWALVHDPDMAVAMAPPMFSVLGGSRHAECAALWRDTERCLSAGTDASVRAAWFLGAAAFCAERQAMKGERYAREAVALYRALGDAQGEARALGWVAASRIEDAADQQQAAFLRMRELVRPDWPPLVLASVARAECQYAYRRGDLDAVEAAFRRWLAHVEGVGNETAADAVALNLADLALARGRAEEAVALSQAPLERLRASRMRHPLAVLSMNLTAALLACDRIEAARSLMAEARALVLAFGMQADWLDYLALLAALEGRLSTAALLLGRADAEFRARCERRELNQRRSSARTRAILEASLEATQLAQLLADGARLSHAEAGALGLEPARAAT